MNDHAIIEALIASGVLVLGFFLRGVITNVKENTSNLTKMYTRVSQNEQSIAHEKEMRQVQFDAINESLEEIKALIKNS